MKALSIKQPWAWAILNANKDVENRDWSTNFRGTVAIHASKSMRENEYFDFCDFFLDLPVQTPVPTRKSLICGAILGTVEIVDCVSESNSPWFFGEYGFVLKNPRRLLKPIPFKGALSFWNVPAEIEQQLIFEDSK